MRTLLLTLALATTAQAQTPTTWLGLHYGQSRNDVRAALAAQHFPVETNTEGSLQSVSDFPLIIPPLRYAFPMRVDLHFTDDGGLMNIVLSLDLNAMHQNYAYVGNDESMMLFAAARLQRALSDKYAQPLDIADDCTADAATLARRQVTCAINWGSTAGSIQLDWATRLPHLTLRYQMLAPDL